MKKSSILHVIIFIIFFGTFTLISILKPQQSFSDNENRLLQQRPNLTWSDLVSGEFGTQYENYLADQFILRDQWINIKTTLEQLRGMREINRIYFAKDNYLIEKKDKSLFESEQANKNISNLSNFLKTANENPNIITSNVMFVPTAETVLKDKLPAKVNVYDQFDWINSSGVNTVDLNNVFTATELPSPLYYRTDHHWTTYGAYLAYCQWADVSSLTPISLDNFNVIAITDSFYGTLHSKVNTTVPADTIEVYERKDKQVHLDIYTDDKTIELYDESKLETKDQYGYFLGGNYGQVTIMNDDASLKDRTLLLIKDSYANCFVPFLTEHFNKVIMIDLRHTNQSITETIINESITDILVLYSTDNFSTDRNIYKLNR